MLSFLQHSRQKAVNWEEMRENERKKRKWRGRKSLSVSISPLSLHSISLSLHFLIFLHFLILSPYPRSLAARLPQVVTAWYKWTMTGGIWLFSFRPFNATPNWCVYTTQLVCLQSGGNPSFDTCACILYFVSILTENFALKIPLGTCNVRYFKEVYARLLVCLG